MPSTYSPDLRIELMANGEKTGTWGSITNTNLGTLIEDAISGLANVSVTASSQALTAFDGVYDESRNAAINLTTTLSAPFSVFVPPVTKLYVVVNSSSYPATVYASTVIGNTTAAGLGVTVPANSSCLLRCSGANIYEQLNRIVGNFTVDGLMSLNGTVDFNGNITLDGSAFLGGSQTAAISVASPSIVTVSAAPPSGTAIVFSTTGTLPVGLTAGTTYFVSKINDTTFNFSASSSLTPLVAVTVSGVDTQTVSTVSLAVTPPIEADNTQLATTAFVKDVVAAIPPASSLSTANWNLAETFATQTAVITIASPAVVGVTAAPALGTAVSFSSTGALPTGITADVGYYVFNRTPTTYNLATTPNQAQIATLSITSPGVVTVAAAPLNGDVVTFSTTGALPTGITAGTNYFVINRAATTFQIASVAGGTAINFTGTQSGVQTATWRTLVNTSGTQSGVQTETTSKLYFSYKTLNRMSLDLGGNLVTTGNITAYGTV